MLNFAIALFGVTQFATLFTVIMRFYFRSNELLAGLFVVFTDLELLLVWIALTQVTGFVLLAALVRASMKKTAEK